jgi:Omp85 superfamily domain
MLRRLEDQTARRTARLRFCALIAACACAANASAQETRADLLEQERAARAQDSAAAVSVEPTWLERTFSWGESKLQNASTTQDGFYLLGGIVPGSGISAGTGYRYPLFGKRAILDVSAAGSWNQSTMWRSRLEWPQLFTDHLSVGTEMKYQDLTQINFFGVGDGSSKTSQTNYGLTDMDVLGFATVRPNRWLSIGGRVGVLGQVGIAAGTSSSSPSTGGPFNAVTAPGLTEQPEFLHADLSVDVDTEDVPGYATSGGRYHVAIATFRDRNYSQYSFQRLDADAAESIPLLHKNWVISLRGRVVLTETAAGQEVPFYLMPTLGGSTTLRGFLDYRFRDRDLALFNAEYRWPLFRALDGALFYDAGVVAPSAQALLAPNAHTDYGAGVRLHSTRRTILRLDVARSTEGNRVLFTFTAPHGAPSRTVAPYAP